MESEPDLLAPEADEATAAVWKDWALDRDRFTWETVLGLVLAHPEKDGPRWAAALWLGDDGQKERAEFVRVQLEQWHTPCLLAGEGEKPYELYCDNSECRHCWLDRRAQDLRECRVQDPREPDNPQLRCSLELAIRWPRIRLLFLPGLGDYGFRRGFVEELTCTAADWLAHADAVRAAHPIRKVALTTHPEITRGIHKPGVRGWASFRNADWRLAVPPDLDNDGAELALLNTQFPGIDFTLPAPIS